MKITKITDEAIVFENGSEITFNHEPDCCEWNYADFEQLDDLGRDYDYTFPLKFETVNGAGFRFGDERRMFFIPCYSDQNGYYSDDVDIYFDGKAVLNVECEEI